jgi:hypothetical protein
MNRLRFNIVGVLAVIALCLSLARPAVAQSVTSSDIQRLQDQLYDVSNDVSRMRGSQDTSGRLQGRLMIFATKWFISKSSCGKRIGQPKRVHRSAESHSGRAFSGACQCPDSASTDSGTWRTNSDPNATRQRPTARLER